MKNHPKILVVWDDDFERLVIERVLVQYQPRLHLASTFDTAAEMLTDNSWDLLITDFHLGQFDGSSLLRRLRKAAVSVPILVIAESLYVKQAKEAGATTVLTKPYMVKDLITAIEKLLSKGE